MNPLLIESSFLIPSYYVLLFMAIALIYSLWRKSENDVFFFSGLALFSSILIYFIYHIFSLGLLRAYINNGVDISCFIFCVPFFLFSIVRAKNTT